MYPILFPSDATTFTTNGLGRLTDAKSCKVTEERNGLYELEMEYPLHGIHFNDLSHSKIILAKPFQNGNLQPFRIYRIERKATDLSVVYARHISYQLSYIPVSKFTADSAQNALSGLKSHSAEDNPFNFSTDITRAGSFVVTVPDSIRAWLGGQEGSIIDTWKGGEYEWDGYNVILHEHRGSNKGVKICYGKNLVSLTQDENIENTITGIYPYWQNDGEEKTAVMNSCDYVGYLSSNTFYEDKWHTTPIPTESNKYYYDITTKKIYNWNGSSFVEINIGQYGDGNIDLYDRPVLVKKTTKKVKDEENSTSKKTVYTEEVIDEIVTLGSFIQHIGNQYIVLPTIFKDANGNAIEKTQAQSVTEYNNTGKYLGKYSTNSAAQNYQKKVELECKRLYENISQTYTYVELPEKTVYSSNASNFPYKRTQTLDCGGVFQTAPTEAQLRAYANEYITDNNIGIPKVSLDVEFVNLSETPEYRELENLQSVNLCDTVTVIFSELGVSSESKVIKTEYDVLTERYNSISIGDPKSDLSSTIADQMEQIQYRPTQTEIQNSIDRATGVLNSGMRGHVVINRNEDGYSNEILFLDNDNVVAARNVLRINMNGIGFSSTGYEGPYFQSWTNDGHLTLGGVNDSYGDFTILDENQKPTLEIDKDGLKLLSVGYSGYLYENVFYANQARTRTLPAKRNKAYYDYTTGKIYKWDGSHYVVDANAGVIASMTHDGVNIKEGSIEIWMQPDEGDEAIGFKADGNQIRLGDFVVDHNSRDMLQSMGNTTGMAASARGTQLHLWAGWHGSDDFRLAVNEDEGLRVMNGSASDYSYEYVVGDEIYKLWNAVNGGGGGGGGGCGGDSGGCGCDGDSCFSPGGDPNECNVVG